MRSCPQQCDEGSVVGDTGDDGEKGFLLKALDSLQEALRHRNELDSQVLELLVRESVALLWGIHLVLAPACNHLQR